MSLRKIVNTGYSMDLYDGEAFGFAGAVILQPASVELSQSTLGDIRVVMRDKDGFLQSILYTKMYVEEDGVEVTI